MSLQLPELAQALAQQGGQQGGQPPLPAGLQPQPGPAQDPLPLLQKILNDLHTLITLLKDPQQTQDAIKCSLGLAALQTQLMNQNQGGGSGPQPQG